MPRYLGQGERDRRQRKGRFGNADDHEDAAEGASEAEAPPNVPESNAILSHRLGNRARWREGFVS
ncbi:MAG: hypothetical protein ABI877_14865 [Gemmatimonadaceae bacterium]